MVLFQRPGAAPPTPWDVGAQEWAEVMLWLVAFIGIIWGFFLIVSYINTRKRHHLLWGASFSIMWIVFHQVIVTDKYDIMFGPYIAMMLAFIPGLLAAGLLMAVFNEKKIIGNLFALAVLIMAGLIALFKFDPFSWIGNAAEFEVTYNLPRVIEHVPSMLVMALHIPSALIIVVLPIYTTIKNQTRWPAIFMSIGGIVFGVVGFILTLVMSGVFEPYIPIDYRYVVMALFPMFLIVSVLCFAFGTIMPAKWNFGIPGIEFEERA